MPRVTPKVEMVAGRIALVFVTTLLVAFAVVELAVALNLEFTRTFVRMAMWAGSVLWLMSAIGCAFSKHQHYEAPLWGIILIAAIAAGSVGGLYTSDLLVFARWANAMMALVFPTLLIIQFREIWLNSAIPAQNPGQSN